MFMSIFNLRGAQTDRFRYEVFQNLFFSPMNTGFLRDTVATVLTVYGIETDLLVVDILVISYVATVLTVYGIETYRGFFNVDMGLLSLQQYLPFTVLKPTI